MSQTFKPPVTLTTDSSGNIVLTPSSGTPPPPPPPPPPIITTGNFGPEWFYQPPGGGATGSVQQVNGILQCRLANQGGSDSSYGYCIAQRGSFPWGSSQGDPLPANITEITVKANVLLNQFISGHSHAQYYIGLYYRCANAFNGWLDTQVRVEWIDRSQSPDGDTSTYGGSADPGVQADGFSLAQTSPLFDIDPEAQFRKAALAWGIDPNLPHTLDGLEIGAEGFGVVELDVDFLSYNLVIGPVSTPPPPPPVPTPTPTPTGTIEQVVVVIFENTGLQTTLGVPGFAAFAQANAISNNWSHLGHPSEPNYIGIAFGDMFGVSSDGDSTTHPPPTILDLVRKSGRTFAVIQNGSRGFDHNGFLLESPDISNTIAGDSAEVIAAVDAGTNFIWFTPSDSQNAHDNSISSAWDWFNSWLPQLQTAMAKRNSLLILTFDESFDDSVVYTVFAGPAAKKGYSSSNPYNHYSFGKLIESIWGGTGLRNSDGAANPTEFFR